MKTFRVRYLLPGDTDIRMAYIESECLMKAGRVLKEKVRRAGIVSIRERRTTDESEANYEKDGKEET